MTAPKPTHKPIGTIGLATGAALALMAVVFIAWGIKDIREGQGTGPLFFLGWLIFIALVMVFGFRRKKATDAADEHARRQTGGLPVLLLTQDSAIVNGETCDGWITCHPTATIIIALLVAGLFVGIWAINRKKP